MSLFLIFTMHAHEEVWLIPVIILIMLQFDDETYLLMDLCHIPGELKWNLKRL